MGSRPTAGRAGLIALLLALAFVPAAQAQAVQTIDTMAAWDGAGYVCCFGPLPNTTTYGQVVTAPAQPAVLESFSLVETGETATVRGALYAWNGSRATGTALWESAPRSLPHLAGWQQPAFSPQAPTQPGQQYVLLVSVSKDYDEDQFGSASISFGFVERDPYPAGRFVFLNDDGDESRWTRVPWQEYGINGDLAFRASFRQSLPTSAAECKAGGWRRFQRFKNQGQCVAFVKRHGPASS